MSLDLQRVLHVMKEAGLEINTENLLAVLEAQKTKPESSSSVKSPVWTPGPWYYFKMGAFETVVSYLKAKNVEDAKRYAASKFCEWYLTEYPIYPDDLREPKVLNHDEFNQWCAKMWPGTAVSDTQQST